MECRFSPRMFKRRWIIIFSFLVFVSLFHSGTAAQEIKQDYMINLERKAGEPLTQEAYYDISFLTARSLYHVLEAIEALEFEKTDKAKEETAKARKLISVVYNMLPVNTVKMTVKDTGGQVVYDDEREVRAREIPIFAGMTTMEVVKPIIQYKKSHATLKDLKPAGEATVFTLVLVDIDYVGNQLDLSKSLLKTGEVDEGYQKLEDALVFGVRLEVFEEDQNLTSAIEFVTQAYRQLDKNDYKSARKSLKKARLSLSKYVEATGVVEDEDMKEILQRIEEIEANLEKPGQASVTKRVWNRLVKKLRKKT